MALNTKLLQGTFDHMIEDRHVFFDKFYNYLLADYPALRPFFDAVDMDRQKSELSRALWFVLRNLEHRDRLKAFLQSLGTTHDGFGIKPIHYDWMARSLIKTMESILGDQFTPEVREEWLAVLNLIEVNMLAGAAEKVHEMTPLPPPVKAVVNESPAEDIKDFQVKRLVDGIQIELPSEVKDSIRSHIRAAIEAAILREIQVILSEEVQKVNPAQIESLLKKTG